ncbi:hypothetical protein VTJ49DRAFT_2602 [Mycothermus thermophilus]|uniref:Uncharacterized protein n=1 Tax=Humicola insolens TaxID=85995 RepID=A0ABR3VA46_HUMIN
MMWKKTQHEGVSLALLAKLLLCLILLALPSFAQDDAAVATVTVTVTNAVTTAVPSAPSDPSAPSALSALPTRSFVGGNLAAQAPYGLPAEDFLRAAVVASDATNAFSITGYNICPDDDDDDDDVFSRLDGWTLKAHVACDVSLSGATSLNLTQDMWITAATLSMTPPPFLEVDKFNASAWRVSAVVFPDGIPEDRLSLLYQGDGTCDDALSDECIDQLQDDCSAAAAAAAATTDGTWGDVQVPDCCKDYFVGTNGTNYEINPIGNYSFLPSGQSPFFAAGLYPSSEPGNETAVDAVKRRAWPVVITWARLNDTGAVIDTRSWISCPRAVDDSSKRVRPTSPATKTVPGRYMKVMYGAAAGAVIAYLIGLTSGYDNATSSNRRGPSGKPWYVSWIQRRLMYLVELLGAYFIRRKFNAVLNAQERRLLEQEKRRLEEERERFAEEKEREQRRRAHPKKHVHWTDQQDDSEEDWDTLTPVLEEMDGEYPDPPTSVPSPAPATPAPPQQQPVDPELRKVPEDVRGTLDR